MFRSHSTTKIFPLRLLFSDLLRSLRPGLYLSSGLQINVSDQKYAFKSNLTSILFNPDMPVFPVEDPPHLEKKSTNSTLNQTLSLLSSIPPLQFPPSVSQPLTCMDDQTLIEKASQKLTYYWNGSNNYFTYYNPTLTSALFSLEGQLFSNIVFTPLTQYP